MWLLCASTSARSLDSRSCGRDVPYPELWCVERTATEFVTAPDYLRDASSLNGSARYDLFAIGATATGVVLSDSRIVPGLSQTANGARIIDIDAFIATCPQNDPATKEILGSLRLSVNGVPRALEPCIEPVPLDATPSPHLYYLQMLRVAYYMDQRYSGLYPWTSGRYWSWIKERIGGIDIDDSSSPSNYCCMHVPPRLPIVHIAGAWAMEPPYDFVYDVIAGLVLLLTHEVRHTEGIGHVVCMSGSKTGLLACDQDFDPANLSAFGVAWWMANLIETGKLNMGLSCKPANAKIAAVFLHSQDVLADEFMGSRPPPSIPSPIPGGPCPASQ